MLRLLPQVEFAHAVLLNKCDLATEAQLQQVPSVSFICSWSAGYEMLHRSVHVS